MHDSGLIQFLQVHTAGDQVPADAALVVVRPIRGDVVVELRMESSDGPVAVILNASEIGRYGRGAVSPVHGVTSDDLSEVVRAISALGGLGGVAAIVRIVLWRNQIKTVQFGPNGQLLEPKGLGAGEIVRLLEAASQRGVEPDAGSANANDQQSQS